MLAGAAVLPSAAISMPAPPIQRAAMPGFWFGGAPGPRAVTVVSPRNTCTSPPSAPGGPPSGSVCAGAVARKPTSTGMPSGGSAPPSARPPSCASCSAKAIARGSPRSSTADVGPADGSGMPCVPGQSTSGGGTASCTVQRAYSIAIGAPDGSTASAVSVVRGSGWAGSTISSAGSACTASTRSFTTSDCFSRSPGQPRSIAAPSAAQAAAPFRKPRAARRKPIRTTLSARAWG